MRFQRIAVLALGLSLAAGVAEAQQSSMWSVPVGMYFRGEGGWNHMEDLNANESSTTGAAKPFSFNGSLDEGWLLGGGMGYAWGPYALEVGLDYRENVLNSISSVMHGGFPATVTNGNAGGRLAAISETINGYYSFPVNWSGITPYVGAGAGALILKYNGLSQHGTAILGDSDVVPAVQAMIGAHYNLTANWEVGLEYRFINGFNPSFKDSIGNNLSTNDYQSHSVMVSFSYSLGAAEPPPPPVQPAAVTPPPVAAPPAGPRNLFIVFFDFNKATLTEDGKRVLDAAANAFGHNQPVRIEVTGYTDTMGTAQYNLGLSQRRADVVRDYLVAHGVPGTRQDVAWKGKTDLRVPTPDQVREPQNRRVEIILP